MANNRIGLTGRALEEAVLQEKSRGTPDIEIGRKYGVTYRYIERLVTKAKGINVSSVKSPKRIRALLPRGFEEEQTTVWSFKRRGTWATHSGEYRGNWSPYIPRNVILKYSKPGELVLDYFCGAGTTAVECKLLGRKCIALDINDKAIELARANLSFPVTPELGDSQLYEPELYVGDARNLSSIPDGSIDLICAHPPYANIIHYTDGKEGDLSFYDIEEFLNEMRKVAEESYRVLKMGGRCAILIGDMRKKKHVIPLGFKLIDVYLTAGFKLKELVIKRQHNCKTTGFWYENSIKYNFLLLAHEYLPIFEKPKAMPVELSGKNERRCVIPVAKDSLPIAKNLTRLESTTVWLLPKGDFEEHLNKNVIDRFSDGKSYSVVSFASQRAGDEAASDRVREGIKLLFIKSPFSRGDLTSLGVEFYLQEVKELVLENVPRLDSDGFIVIQTQDVRLSGYVEPLAKRLVDALTHDSLWLKEIVVVTPDGGSSNPQVSKEFLEITHQYLLVYEVQ